jgi:hypothetical protein
LHGQIGFEQLMVAYFWRKRVVPENRVLLWGLRACRHLKPYVMLLLMSERI